MQKQCNTKVANDTSFIILQNMKKAISDNCQLLLAVENLAKALEAY